MKKQYRFHQWFDLQSEYTKFLYAAVTLGALVQGVQHNHKLLAFIAASVIVVFVVTRMHYKYQTFEPNDKRSMVIRIDNVTEAQALAIESMFAQWMILGNVGSSRWTSFFADGDGNFHPKITVDGHKAECTPLVDHKKLWESGEYRIDFDPIAWKLREHSDT